MQMKILAYSNSVQPLLKQTGQTMIEDIHINMPKGKLQQRDFEVRGISLIFYCSFCILQQMLFKSRVALAVLSLCMLAGRAAAYNTFCSVTCDKRDCTSASYNTCTQCRGPFRNVSNVCQTNTDNYEIVDTSPDIPGGTLDLSPKATPSETCGQYTVSLYTANSDHLTVTCANGVLVPFFELRLIFWTVLIDDWKDSDKAVLVLDGGETKTHWRQGRLDTEKNCGGGDVDDLLIVDRAFTYNTTQTTFTLDISFEAQKNVQWGVKEIFVLARKCHAACWSCWNETANGCWSCNLDDQMKLSGTTCAANCLDGYGDTLDGDICVLCDLHCTSCFESATNCLSCQPTGNYRSYLLESNSSCEYPCPEGMYGNNTDNKCYECDPECISCSGTSSHCYQCNKDLLPGYAWNDYTCYSPCPISTFLDNNDTNCTECSRFCIQCEINSTFCSSCTLTGTNMAYFLDNYCYRVCPDEYYEETNNGTENLCLSCDASCFECTNNPTPCQYCNQGFFLYEEACGGTCPEPEYFPDNTTRECLLCEDYCVKLRLDMYFPTSLNDKIYIDMIFSEKLDFTTFDYEGFQTITIDSNLYTLDMFTFTYTLMSDRSYRIVMEPKGYIFLYNATINVITMDMPSPKHYAVNGRPFQDSNYALGDSLVWFVIKAPDMTDMEKQIIDGLSQVSDSISDLTTKPYVQELKKMGLFMFLMSGAQITSTSVLVNNIPSQNMYEGVRFWAMFTFFDVPNWEQNSDKTRHIVVPPVSQVLKEARMLTAQLPEEDKFQQLGSRRVLFDTGSIEWRFARINQSSFFIYDTYPLIFLVCLSWILMLVAYCLNRRKPLLFKKHMGKFYTFLHKVHEISILYAMLATILEWLYFQSSFQRWMSFGFCLVFNIYFLVYELYCYYDMMKYPAAAIGNEKYEYYAIKYGSLLRNIRYQEYDMKQPWSPRHWLRPYNYHLLSYYKKLMMVVSLPLFYHTLHGQPAVLIALQTLEILRFVLTWPFIKRWRNIVRLLLELCMLLFFVCILLQGILVQEIMLNNQSTVGKSIRAFYKVGWIGFVMVFIFNISFILLLVYDVVRGCGKTNRQLMDEARLIYYYDKLKAFEQQNQDVPLGMVNKWVRLGNLNNRNYDELPDVNIRLEYFCISKLPRSNNYEVHVKKLLELYMNVEFNYHKENNINAGGKLSKKFTLHPRMSKQMYSLVDGLYRKYQADNVQSIIIKTFLKVEQSLYKPGERVEFKREQMSQRIEMESSSGDKKVENLSKMLQGFPIPAGDIKLIA